MIQNNHSIYNSNIRFAFCSVDFSRLKSNEQTLYRSIDLSNMMRFLKKPILLSKIEIESARKRKREKTRNYIIIINLISKPKLEIVSSIESI